MLKIRLQRTGRKNNPSYRIIVVDSSVGPKSGKYIEKLGTYDSIRKTKSIEKERIQHWMKNGAEVSDTVFNILVADGIIKGTKKNVLPKKTPIKKEVKEGEQEQAAEVTGGAENKAEDTTTQKAEGEPVAEKKGGEEKTLTEQPKDVTEEKPEQKTEETTEQNKEEPKAEPQPEQKAEQPTEQKTEEVTEKKTEEATEQKEEPKTEPQAESQPEQKEEA